MSLHGALINLVFEIGALDLHRSHLHMHIKIDMSVGIQVVVVVLIAGNQIMVFSELPIRLN